MSTHRCLSSLAAALTASAALTSACTSVPGHPGRSYPISRTARATHAGEVIPTESPVITAAASGTTPAADSAPDRPVPGLTPAHVPDAVHATRDPITTARAWAVAANSSNYLDPEPGSWTLRSAPFVTGQERTDEQEQRAGGGGATWAQIEAARCVTGLRQLSAGIPSDAPSGPDRHIVYVAGLTALTCVTGQVQLSQFAAQLTVDRVRGRWLVAAVRH